MQHTRLRMSPDLVSAYAIVLLMMVLCIGLGFFVGLRTRPPG